MDALVKALLDLICKDLVGGVIWLLWVAQLWITNCSCKTADTAARRGRFGWWGWLLLLFVMRFFEWDLSESANSQWLNVLAGLLS